MTYRIQKKNNEYFIVREDKPFVTARVYGKMKDIIETLYIKDKVIESIEELKEKHSLNVVANITYREDGIELFYVSKNPYLVFSKMIEKVGLKLKKGEVLYNVGKLQFEK